MAKKVDKVTRGIQLACLALVLLVGAWISQYFLPVWKWIRVDFEKLSQQTQTESDPDNRFTTEELAREYDVIVRYNPRGKGDPIPFQIVRMAPEWPRAEEANFLVRVQLWSDRDGKPPGLGWISTNPRDRFLRFKGWRLPPGMLESNAARPLIIYQGQTWGKLPVSEAISWDLTVRGWGNDDEDYDDGYIPPDPNEPQPEFDPADGQGSQSPPPADKP